jgi:UDP-N-acetylmuramyl pentapeptide synthase
LNFDNEAVREIRNKTPVFTLTFGFQKMADLRASDLSIDQKESACNFKIDYEGNIIPIWLKNICSEQEVLSILAAISCGIQLGLNLVEISQALKDFK